MREILFLVRSCWRLLYSFSRNVDANKSHCFLGEHLQLEYLCIDTYCKRSTPRCCHKRTSQRFSKDGSIHHNNTKDLTRMHSTTLNFLILRRRSHIHSQPQRITRKPTRPSLIHKFLTQLILLYQTCQHILHTRI